MESTVEWWTKSMETDRAKSRGRNEDDQGGRSGSRISWWLTNGQSIGSDPNAIAMRRVVNFYEKLPRGAAPEVKATGILGRYQAKHFGKNPSAKRMYQSG